MKLIPQIVINFCRIYHSLNLSISRCLGIDYSSRCSRNLVPVTCNAPSRGESHSSRRSLALLRNANGIIVRTSKARFRIWYVYPLIECARIYFISRNIARALPREASCALLPVSLFVPLRYVTLVESRFTDVLFSIVSLNGTRARCSGTTHATLQKENQVIIAWIISIGDVNNRSHFNRVDRSCGEIFNGFEINSVNFILTTIKPTVVLCRKS